MKFLDRLFNRSKEENETTDETKQTTKKMVEAEKEKVEVKKNETKTKDKKQESEVEASEATEPYRRDESERKIKVRKNYVPKKRIEKNDVEEIFGVEQRDVEVGKIYDCEIISVIDDNYIVSIIGYYVEGIIPKDQLEVEVEIGDIVQAVLYRIYSEQYFLSVKRSQNYKLVDKYLEVYKNNEIIEGVVKRFEDNNFVVEIESGFEALVYIKNIDTKYVTNPEEYIGKKYEFLIRKLLRNKKYKFELSRRELLQQKEAIIIEKLEVGQSIVVSKFTQNKGGLTFNYEGIQGFIPLSEVSHHFIKSSSDINLTELKDINVEIIELKKDKRGYTIVASIKRLLASPFEEFLKVFNEEDQVVGKVQNVKDYGLFIELNEGVRGLLHKNDMATEDAGDFKKREIGSLVEVIIAEIDQENQKIKLLSQVKVEEVVGEVNEEIFEQIVEENTADEEEKQEILNEIDEIATTEEIAEEKQEILDKVIEEEIKEVIEKEENK